MANEEQESKVVHVTPEHPDGLPEHKNTEEEFPLPEPVLEDEHEEADETEGQEEELGEQAEAEPTDPSGEADKVKKKRDLPVWTKKIITKKEQRHQQEIERLKREHEHQLALYRQSQISASATHQQAHVQPDTPDYEQIIKSAAPLREQYENEIDFLDAYSDYREKVRVFREETAKQQQHQQAYQAYVNQKTTELAERGRASYPDFDEVIKPLFNQEFRNNQGVERSILESKYKHDILYYLGKNLSEANRIARLDPYAASAEIGELIGRFKERDKRGDSKRLAQPLTPVKSNQPTSINRTATAEEAIKKNASREEIRRHIREMVQANNRGPVQRQ